MNTQELTSLITRLEEEYGKATPKDWVAGEYENGGYWYGRIFFPGDPRNHLTNTRDCPMSKGDVAFIADAHNSMPTLLSALKHYMAVAEAGHNVGCMKCGQPMHLSCSSIPDVIPEFRNLDTPSLLNDKT